MITCYIFHLNSYVCIFLLIKNNMHTLLYIRFGLYVYLYFCLYVPVGTVLFSLSNTRRSRRGG